MREPRGARDAIEWPNYYVGARGGRV